MKKTILRGLYNTCLSLSNYFDNKLLTKCKVFLGTSLLVLMGSCSDDPKEEPEVTCYVTVEEPDSNSQDSTSYEEPEVSCYLTMQYKDLMEEQDTTEKQVSPLTSPTDTDIHLMED